MEKSVKFTHTGHSHAIGNFSAGDVFRGPVEMCRHFVEDAMCAQWEDAPAGDAPAGDAPAGDAPAGDAPAGDAPAGDAPAGDAPAGDAPAGDAPAGKPAVKAKGVRK